MRKETLQGVVSIGGNEEYSYCPVRDGMRDMTETCLGDLKEKHPEATATELSEYFCKRCRNVECSRSGWQGDPMRRRVQEQEERLLHPKQADPTSSKYEPLQRVGFEDRREEAESWGVARPKLKVLPSQTEWEAGDRPVSPISVRDPWSPTERVAPSRVRITFTEDGGFRMD